jgi:hypothetical protein
MLFMNHSHILPNYTYGDRRRVAVLVARVLGAGGLRAWSALSSPRPLIKVDRDPRAVRPPLGRVRVGLGFLPKLLPSFQT